MNKKLIFPISIITVLILIMIITIIVKLGSRNVVSANERGNVVVDTEDTTSKAVFYNFDYQGTKMEFFVVRDPKGVVRLAFNRCQVCYDSGRGYFVQEKNEFVCQNCGNRYSVYSIGNDRGGCNPSPISTADKIVSGNFVEIKESVFQENKYMFARR